MEHVLAGFLDKFTYLAIVGVLSAAGLGVPISEDLTLLLSGALASRGVTAYWPTLAVGYFGVLIGDALIAAADEGDPELPALASIAKAAASDAYMQTAIHAVQIHGGIGFTWDNDTHLWFKRAKSSEVFLGSAAFHRERMMQMWNV